MRRRCASLVLGAGVWCLGPAGAVDAHHAAAAQYDVEKVVQFKGVLTKVEWVNPHTHMSFDVKGTRMGSEPTRKGHL